MTGLRMYLLPSENISTASLPDGSGCGSIESKVLFPQKVCVIVET